jgi:hypothetical protein
MEVRCGRETISAAQELTEGIAAPSEKHAQLRC